MSKKKGGRSTGDSFGAQQRGRATSFMIKKHGDDFTSGLNSQMDAEYDWSESIEEVGAPIKSRQGSFPVLYSPEQTERYQSQYLRYARSLKIVPAGNSAVSESLRKFFFESKSSPTGYWEATEDRGSGPGKRTFSGGQCPVDYNVSWLNAWRKTNPSNPLPSTDIGSAVMRGPIPDYKLVCKNGSDFPAPFNFAQGTVAYDMLCEIRLTFLESGEQTIRLQDALYGPVKGMRFRQAGAGVIYEVLCHGKPHEGVRLFGPKWTRIYQSDAAAGVDSCRLEWQLYKRVDGRPDDDHWVAVKLGKSVLGAWRNPEDFTFIGPGISVLRAGFGIFDAPPDNCGQLTRQIVKQPFSGGQCPTSYSLQLGVEWRSVAERVGLAPLVEVDSRTVTVQGPISAPYVRTASVPELGPPGLPDGFAFLLKKTIWVVDGNGDEVEIGNLPGHNVTAWKPTISITVNRVDALPDTCGVGPLPVDGPIVGPLPEGVEQETDFRGYDWSCNCPDYTKTLPPQTDSKYLDNRLGRSWVESGAGTPGDCKHIYATKIVSGVYFIKPTDLPAGGDR